ncbi:MAG TPA: extracellular solute-binding protein [Candidatus Binatia bacterium]|nr:extracellular solute-binding protein [Candidatus Binatia bacterium]
MKIKTSLLLGLAASAMLSFAANADTTLNALFMQQAAYSDDDIKNMIKDFEAANPGITVKAEFVPYEALHDKIVAAQGAGAQGYDVILFDDIWPAEFAKHKVLVDVTSKIPSEYQSQVFDGAWTTVEYNKHRYGMPWILDTKYLFYNKDMLTKAGIANPPKTWDELVADAKTIKDKGIVKYPIVWSWAQAEAVICDYATLVDAYGGKFFDNGKPVINSGASLEAVKFMDQTVKDGITNPSSKEYLEDDVKKVFTNGDAAFALNWTYMYAAANDPKQSKIAGQVGVVAAPGVSGKTDFSAVNGAMGLGIASNSTHPDEAWKFITFLTSQPVQNKYAQLSLPIWKSSYDDPAVQKGQEDLVAAAKYAINAMFARPAMPSYQEMSTILQKALQEVVIGKASPEDAMGAAQKQIERLR